MYHILLLQRTFYYKMRLPEFSGVMRQGVKGTDTLVVTLLFH